MELNEKQKLAIRLLVASPLREKFYWTGGTLLAYHYLKHRISLDLDFFSETAFSFAEINEFVQYLKEKGQFANVRYQKIFDRHEFLLENSQILRLEFVYFNDQKKALEKRFTVLGVYVDSLADIATNKTMAYFDRTEPKDLFDLYFLLTHGRFTPHKLLTLVHKKFGVRLDEGSFWSEAFKSIPLLHTLKPLILKEGEQQEKLLKQIERYFKEKSIEFLKKNLE